MVALRAYQEEAVQAVRDEWAGGNRSTLLVMATGTGKTTVFGEVAHRSIENGNGVLVIAHRGELIDQAAARLSDMCGCEAEIEKASSAYSGASPLCIGSVQTLKGERLDRFELDGFKVLVVDEAHHAVSDTYREIIERHKEAGGYLLGVTATADRADRRGLSEVFDSIAYEYPLARAVSDGYLVPIRAKCIPLKIDLRAVKVSHGDFQVGELGSALDPYLPEIAKTMAVECAGKKTVCFLPLVATAERMAEELNRAGLRAVAASGYDSADERARKKHAFEHGLYDVLCNSMLYTEGWDCPAVDCVVVLRPTKSRSLYAQMVGRGTRLSPETGKDHLLLLDFLWMTEKHDLARPASLLGQSKDVSEKMQQMLEDGEEHDLEEAADEAEKNVQAEREAALARELEAQRKKKKKLVDPLQFAISIQELDLENYVPTKLWEYGDATAKQRETIEKFGVDSSGIESAGQASAFINALIRRTESGLASPKQIRKLEQFGFSNVGTWTKAQASAMMSKVAACGWSEWRLRAMLKKKNITPETYDPRSDAA